MALGLFLLIVVALLVFVVFSTGQAAGTKQRLSNATDAAAYSAALWRARVLNYDAYANRAIIANEVAIAQAATMVSYARYMKELTDNFETVARYVPYLNTVSEVLKEIAEATAETTQYTALAETAARSTYLQALAAGQKALSLTTNAVVLSRLTTEVARENDPAFFAHLLPGALTGDGAAFTRVWSGDDRRRLKDVVLRSLDDYSTNRDDDLPLRTNCIGALARRGATELIRDHDTDELERWQAYDTMSLHTACMEALPLGWGGAEIAVRAKSELDSLDSGKGSRSKRSNRRAYGEAADDIWTSSFYFGIASVTELNLGRGALKPNEHFPVERLSVMGRVTGSEPIGTAEGFKNGAGRVQPKDRFASGRISALASAEVYFRRPPAKDRRIEYASLYSPYWQARLVPTPEALRMAATVYYGKGN